MIWVKGKKQAFVMVHQLLQSITVFVVISSVCGVSCVFGLWFSMHCVVSLSSFAITSLRKKDLVALL